MIQVIDNFLDKYGLKASGKTFLVGFSGGYDSLCLLDILNTLSLKYGFKLIALHLNHNWRGEESLKEALTCKDFCEKKSIEFISETLKETNCKTESFARKARYKFFLKYAKLYPNSIILTGHNKNDNAETIIYRIIKGTGLNGLQGILPKKNIDGVFVYRPLLTISRAEIENYCEINALIANKDSSNLNINYKRNFIRHKIIPLFCEINPQMIKSINSLAEIAISQTNIVNEYLEIIKTNIFIENKILTKEFEKLSSDLKQQIIYDICLQEGLDYDRKKITDILKFIQDNLESKSGCRVSLTNNLWLFVSSKYMYLTIQLLEDKNTNEINISKEGEYKFPDSEYIFSLKKYIVNDKLIFPSENSNYAYADFSKIGMDLSLRTRREGDFINPFGMKGNMKLKKYLNSKKIARHDKDKLILLCKGSEVLWVIGIGLSNKLKVVNKPTHVIRLKNIK
jgi:tRNA(Ile)-lysidine synthase